MLDNLRTLKITGFMDFVHRPGIQNNYKTQNFGNWVCFRLLVRGGIHLLCWVP
jgi:hypothetical protein